MADISEPMTVLLADLRRQGIIVRANGDRLSVKARRPILSATLREIAANKPALLLHLVRAADEVAAAEAEYHRLWLQGIGLDDQLQAATEDGNAEQAARLRAELSALGACYDAAKLLAEVAQTPGVMA